MTITHISWRIILFIVGVMIAGNTFKMKNGSSGIAVLIVISSVIDTLIGALLMLIAALGRLPW